MILVSLASKTVMVANGTGLLPVLSVSLPEMLPFCAHTPFRKPANRIISSVSFCMAILSLARILAAAQNSKHFKLNI